MDDFKIILEWIIGLIVLFLIVGLCSHFLFGIALSKVLLGFLGFIITMGIVFAYYYFKDR